MVTYCTSSAEVPNTLERTTTWYAAGKPEYPSARNRRCNPWQLFRRRKTNSLAACVPGDRVPENTTVREVGVAPTGITYIEAVRGLRAGWALPHAHRIPAVRRASDPRSTTVFRLLIGDADAEGLIADREVDGLAESWAAEHEEIPLG